MTRSAARVYIPLDLRDEGVGKKIRGNSVFQLFFPPGPILDKKEISGNKMISISLSIS
jgi:hypothetical protein